MAVINNVKDKIEEIAPGLPRKTLSDGTVSQLTIVPFYDRTHLITETISTLEHALTDEILITILVVIVLVLNLRASVLISILLPVAVLMTFIVMRYAGVDANVVALSGIAIAIGVMVDVGIVFVENMLRHFEMQDQEKMSKSEVLSLIYKSTIEVAPAVSTALATTIVSFLPVFLWNMPKGSCLSLLLLQKHLHLGQPLL